MLRSAPRVQMYAVPDDGEISSSPKPSSRASCTAHGTRARNASDPQSTAGRPANGVVRNLAADAIVGLAELDVDAGVCQVVRRGEPGDSSADDDHAHGTTFRGAGTRTW